MKTAPQKSRLCWARRERVVTAGHYQRLIANLETRGCLYQYWAGMKVACCTEAFVRALLSGTGPQLERAQKGTTANL